MTTLVIYWALCSNPFCRPDGKRRKLFKFTMGTGTVERRCECGVTTRVDLTVPGEPA